MADGSKLVQGELDPLFLKALKIMQSNRPTAADELFEMYEEICRHKRGESKIESEDLSHLVKVSSRHDSLDLKKDSIDKTLGDKTKYDLKDTETYSRPNMDMNNSSNDEDEISTNSTTLSNSNATKKRKLSSDSDTEISDAEAAENDVLSIDLDISSLSCVICKSLSQVNTNRLVECQECHNLFHQECHKPPITENVNDPRFVWYCIKCSKNMKKIANKVIKKPKISTSPLPGVTSGNVSRNSPTPFTKAATIEMKQNAAVLSSHSLTVIQQPFKRLEIPVKQLTSKEVAQQSMCSKDSNVKSKQSSDQTKASVSKTGKSFASDKSSKDSGNSSSSSKTSEGKGHTSQKQTLKNSPSFASAIGASVSGSSLAFSDSLMNANTEGSKKPSSLASRDKK